MKIFNLLVISFAVIAGLHVSTVQAQSVTISGDNIKPLTISRGEFQDMKQSVIMAKTHDERVRRYTGVPLADLLTRAGVLLGDTAKRQTVMSYVEVTAADNYKAIYALAEIDPLFANRPIILADRVDKKDLSAQDGPFQIIVPGEKKHARWTRQVTNIRLVVVKP
ncbi:molybdopterin-dependent oxidoreductase [Mucilaginibacter robiniae]|uniref:Molybdopterin-dependent oxidoreductase n=1 Tax=Mucilaginibacter robiniae TaxID=2728022 RepID=A0A7L5DXV7_9SPHI|nr:molybdopterin-dependent oxidoreductase [Mucilaginibacter robiniae]QJD95601.1 molybdopterin-dependent oxidoreductase [Mucilaginibacter robiniae]